MAEIMAGVSILTVIWNLFLFILSICIIVAVFNISGATQRTAKELAKANARIAMIISHMGIDELKFQPPCSQCLKKGATVQLETTPRPGVLVCPRCKSTRNWLA